MMTSEAPSSPAYADIVPPPLAPTEGVGFWWRALARAIDVVVFGVVSAAVDDVILAVVADPARAERVMGRLHREATGEERGQDRVDVGEGLRAGRSSLLEDTGRPRVAEHHVAGGNHDPAQALDPVIAGWRSLDLTDDDLGDAIEQVVLALDVAVDRHRVDTELLAELAHAQVVEAAPVGEGDAGLEDAFAGEGSAALGRCLRGF
jgi:hypothetical protein